MRVRTLGDVIYASVNLIRPFKFKMRMHDYSSYSRRAWVSGHETMLHIFHTAAWIRTATLPYRPSVSYEHHNCMTKLLCS